MRKPECIQAVKSCGNNSLSTSQLIDTDVFPSMAVFPSGVMASDRKELWEQLSFNESPPLQEDGIFQVHWERGHCRDRKVIFLEILPLFTQGDTAPTCPGRSERCRGTNCLRNWGSEREIIGEIQFQGQQELWGPQQAAGEDTSSRITSGFPPARLSTLLSKKAISWFIPCPDYWGRSGGRINVLQLWWGVEWGKHTEVSEQDTPPGNARRTQNSDHQAIERSFSAALCVHSAFLTALGELQLHRLFPRGLQGKCHENMVIDLSKDEPRETHRKGGERNPEDKFIYLPREGRGRISRPVCSAWGRVCYQPVK